MISADEAYRLGLVNRVVPDDQLMATAEELVDQILQNSQQPVSSAKETILDVIGVCRLLKAWKSLAFGEVVLYSEDNPEPVAHAVGTCAIPPSGQS